MAARSASRATRKLNAPLVTSLSSKPSVLTKTCGLPVENQPQETRDLLSSFVICVVVWFYQELPPNGPVLGWTLRVMPTDIKTVVDQLSGH